MARSIRTPEGLFTYDRDSGCAAYIPSIKSRSWVKPLYAQIAITEKCNQSCPFCYADASPNKDRMWNVEDLMKLIEFLDSWKIFGVAYGGGEPFTHPDMVKIVERTYSKTELDVSLTTNGFAASKEAVDAIESYVGEVRVSIHGLEACALLGKFMNRRFDLGVNLLLMKGNASSLARMVEKCVGMGVKDFLINSFRAVGRGANIKHMEPTVEDHLQLGGIIERFASRAEFKVSGRVASVLRRLIGLGFVPFEGEARGRIIAITVDREVKPSSLSEETHPFHKPEEIAEIYSRCIAGGANREGRRVEAAGYPERACW